MHSTTSPLALRIRLLIPSAWVLFALVLLAGPAPAQEAGDGQEHLPTPYSAEEIRDAWFEGFEVLAHFDLPQGERYVLTTVREWSEDEVTLAEQPVTAAGQDQGEARVYSATWQQLQNHALFPADKASREHVTRSTALGELEGWLYRIQEDDGSVSEFFFADGMAGAPVVAQRIKDGETLFQVRQLRRSEREP